MENELTCCVCLDLYTDPLMLPCSHNFCKKCLWDLYHHSQSEEQFRRQINCPKCRREVNLECLDPWSGGINNLPLNKALDNVVRVYKNSSRSETKPASKKCITHMKPQSLYCQTCKRALCEDCVLQSHSGFGHGVKEIDDFIEEEKDKARASFQELDSLKKDIVAADAEVTTYIVNSKARELQLKKAVEDQFEVVRRCIETQRSKALDDVTAQLTRSRTQLEALAGTCSSLKADIRVLRNNHRDALQETNPERQLKLLQALTLRLSTFLTFKGMKKPVVPKPSGEQDGHLENLEGVLNVVRQLNWTDSSKQTGDPQTKATQTDTVQKGPAWVFCASRGVDRTPRTLDFVLKATHKAENNKGPREEMSLKDLLTNATRELRELTGHSEGTQDASPESFSMTDTIEQLQQLRLEHEAQVAQSGAKGKTKEMNARSGGTNSPHENGNGASCMGLNGAAAGGVLGGMICSSGLVLSPLQPPLGGHVESDSTSIQKVKTPHAAKKKKLFPNGLKDIFRRDSEEDSQSQDEDGTEENHLSNDAHPGDWTPDKKRWVPSTKPDTLKLYFGNAASHNSFPGPSELTLAASHDTIKASAVAGVPANQTSGASEDTKEEHTETNNRPSSTECKRASQAAPSSSQTAPQTQGAMAGPSSPGSLFSFGPASEVAQLQCCGVGARPKVRTVNQRPGGVGYGRSFSGGCLDSKDERRMGASFKEGLSSAVCTIKSLCRSSFSISNNKDLDVNANDNGVVGASASRKLCEGDARLSHLEQAAARISPHSTPRKKPLHDDRRLTRCRSVGTSPVSLPATAPFLANLSLNTWEPSMGAQRGASVGGGGSPIVKPGDLTSMVSSLGAAPLSSSWPSALPPAFNGTGDQGRSRGKPSTSIVASTQHQDKSEEPASQFSFCPTEPTKRLSEINLSELWPSKPSKPEADEDSDGGAFSLSAANESDSRPASNGTDTAFGATNGASSGLSFENLTFDFVMSSSPKRDTSGSPRFRQRRHQKNRKRSQQSFLKN